MLSGNPRMTDAEFESLADAALAALEHAIDKAGLDVDVQTKGAGVLEIEFADDTVPPPPLRARESWRRSAH
jgi:hypothetical protein